MLRRSLAIASVALVSLTACGSASSDDADADAEDTVAADVAADDTATEEDVSETAADDPDDGVVTETEWADVLPRLTDGGVTRPTHEIVIAATDFVCADVATTSVTTTSEFVAEESEQIAAVAPDAGLDSTDIGAIVGTIASYACASAFSGLTNG